MKKLLVFTSPTCAPCRRQKAEIDEFLDEHPETQVQILDISRDQDLERAQIYGVQRVPAQVLVDAQEQALKTHVGVIPADKLGEFLRA